MHFFLRFRSSQRGQISIMIAVMMSTFILLFAFVINTGMLVNAKINLQNAADLAAYSGAAVQARQLTHISYVNYEMRRQWKKFLFRLYVIGNMAQDSFPRTGGYSPGDPMEYIPNLTSGNSISYGIPTTCVIFNAADNYCHLTTLPGIAMPDASLLDAVTDALRTQLRAIENIRQNNCKAIGMTNKLLNIYWLYNTDPELTQVDSLENGGLDPDQRNVLRVIRGMAKGLGIVPKEILLRFRIGTLQGYVNAPNQNGLSLEKVRLLSGGPDPALYERSVQAFYSAYYTLGNHTFASDTIALDELMSRGGTDSARLLGLVDIKTAFDTYAVDLTTQDVAGAPATSNSQDCKAAIIPVVVNQPLTVGVYKDPKILTYYAIRLRAKAKILFSPFGDMDLKAYSAAQPFGSRIGPSASEVSFVSEGVSLPPQIDPRAMDLVTGKVPNLAIRDKEGAAKGRGWDTKEMVGTLYQMLVQGGGRGSANSIAPNDLERAYTPAMAPNPWEGTRYNIINDLGNDRFVRNFDSDQLASFWAPIFPPGQFGQSSDLIRQKLDELFNTNIQGNVGAGASPIMKIKESLLSGITQYVTQSLQTGSGENREGMNILRISNPFPQPPYSNAPNTSLFVTDPTLFRTSWGSVNDAIIRAPGRVGYSVKFVSFDLLTKNKSFTTATETWNNDLNLDTETEQDIIPFLKH